MRIHQKLSCRKAASTLEYMALILFTLTALFVFREYILRGLSGKWKASSDAVGFGRQYDPRPFGIEGKGGGTIDCYYDTRVNLWLDRDKAERECDCVTIPAGMPGYAQKCTDCLKASKNPYCNSL